MQLHTDVDLFPDCTGSRNESMAKLKINITLSNVNFQENSFTAYVTTTLYDPEACSVLDQHARDYQFAEDKSFVKFLMNLAKQERIEKSRSKHLEIRVQIKVCGTSKLKHSEDNRFKCSEEDDGYMNIVKSDT